MHLLVSRQAVISPPKPIAPSWMTAKWSYDDTEFKKIRLKLDEIKFGPSRDKPLIDKLFVDHVVPNLKELSSAKSYGTPIKPLDYYWAVALRSYFPATAANYRYNAGWLVIKCPAPNSYEFARVAFGPYVDITTNHKFSTSLAQRLLDRWPKDPVVRSYVCSMVEIINVYSPWHDRAVKYAEELVKEFPQRADIFVPQLARAYRIHFSVSMKRSSYKRMMDYFTIASKHSVLTTAQHEAWAKEFKRFDEVRDRLRFKEG